jgi:RNA polymerase sigma-70 factor (ECF subfamily)
MDLTSFHAQRAAQGERESLAWLVAHFQPLVAAQVRMRLGARSQAQDVDDVCAEVWLVLVRRMDTLAPRDGRWAPVVARFLGTTALQVCNNHLRSRLRHGGTAGAAADTSAVRPEDALAAETRGVLTRAVEADLGAAVRAALDRLSQDQREVLVLRLLEQRSNQEIAGILGVPANTVAVRYKRAIEELKARLPAGAFDELWSARG